MSEYEKEQDSASEEAGESKVKLPEGFAPISPPLQPTPIPPPRPPSMKPSPLSAGQKPMDADDTMKEEAPPLKPLLARYPVRKPTVEVVKLDPAKVYGSADEAIVPQDVVAPVTEGFLAENEDDAEVFTEEKDEECVFEDLETEEEEVDELEADVAGSEGDAEEFGSDDEGDDPVSEESAEGLVEDDESLSEIEEEELGDLEDDEIELTLDEASAFEAESEEEEEPPHVNVPDPEAVAELVAQKLKPAVQDMEVLGPEKSKQEELSVPEERVSKWAFWRRPSKRDLQLARMSEGYLEMVDLVRAIRGQLESQNENNLILRESLAHLPEAMKGLDRFSKSQQTVGKALEEIHVQMKSYSDKDERLADSMDGFNSTLKGMDDTSKASMQTFDRVQERMRDSDIRMENLFQNVQNTEEKVGDTMVRLQRNMAIMQIIFLTCLMIVIGVLVFTVVMGQDDEKPEPPQEEKAQPSTGLPIFEEKEMG